KQGSGTTIVETQNHYAGGTLIKAGILDVRAQFFGLGQPDDGVNLSVNTRPRAATTILPGATLRLGDIPHEVDPADNTGNLATARDVGGDGVIGPDGNPIGAIVNAEGTNFIGGKNVTSANHNNPSGPGRPAGGNIFLTTPEVLINVMGSSTLVHLMGIKDN